MLTSAGALARRGILVRRLQALEALTRIHAVVFDKTGTLTIDRLTLGAVSARADTSREQALELAAQLAKGSLHPVSRALVAANGESVREGGAPWVGAQLEEIAGRGIQASFANGQVLKLGSAVFCGMPPSLDAENTTPRAHLADEQGWVASFELQETVRSDAREAVNALRELGLQTWLLSGDREAAAQWVGQAVGVDHVVAEATPEQKLAKVMALQAKGIRLAMVGDGLNDGPVLARADASFALGHAAPLAQAQSDCVVQSGRVMDVAHTVRHARQTMRIVKQNLAWAALYNAVCVPLALVGWMPPWMAGLGMAASSLLVIGNAMRLVNVDGSVQVVSETERILGPAPTKKPLVA
jgi:Cu2+-exporting ATPase